MTLTLSDTSVRTNIQEGWCTALLASRKGVLAWVEPDPVLKNSKGNRSWQKAKDNSPHSDIADSLRQSGRPCHYAVPQALCSGGADPGNQLLALPTRHSSVAALLHLTDLSKLDLRWRCLHVGLPVAWTLAPGSLQPTPRFHDLRFIRRTPKHTPSCTVPAVVSMQQPTRWNWRDFGAHLNGCGSHVRAANREFAVLRCSGHWTLPRSGVGWKELQPGLQPGRVQNTLETASR